MASEVLFAPSAAAGMGWWEGVEGRWLCRWPGLSGPLLDLPQELLGCHLLRKRLCHPCLLLEVLPGQRRSPRSHIDWHWQQPCRRGSGENDDSGSAWMKTIREFRVLERKPLILLVRPCNKPFSAPPPDSTPPPKQIK